MFSQSLPAQLFRWLLALLLTIAVVHHSPALLNSMAQNATEAGCHQGDGSHHHQATTEPSDPSMHHHHDHH